MQRHGVSTATVQAIVSRQSWGKIETLLGSAGLDPTSVIPRLRQFAELLVAWNRGVSNLLSRNDEARLVERHIGESLGPVRAMLESGIDEWLDIGSGGGFPAVPLIIAGVGRRWNLVESRRMKTLFLTKVQQEMGLEAMTVTCARIESLDPPMGDATRGVTSRATLHLVPTLHEAARWVAPGGSAFLWKGERRDAEMRESSSWRESWDLTATLELADTPTVVCRFDRK